MKNPGSLSLFSFHCIGIDTSHRIETQARQLNDYCTSIVPLFSMFLFAVLHANALVTAVNTFISEPFTLLDN